MSIEDIGWEELKRMSLLKEKLIFIEQISNYILKNNIRGEIVEAGVFKGGCSKLLASKFPDRSVYLFDTFTGMKEDDEFGEHRIGDFSNTSLSSVKQYLKNYSNCIFRPGWFPNTASGLEHVKFAMVHADMDLYQSTKSIIEFFWPRITTGGVIVFDDYEFRKCPGVKKAIEEYYPGRNDYDTIRPLYMKSIAYCKLNEAV